MSAREGAPPQEWQSRPSVADGRLQNSSSAAADTIKSTVSIIGVNPYAAHTSLEQTTTASRFEVRAHPAEESSRGSR